METEQEKKQTATPGPWRVHVRPTDGIRMVIAGSEPLSVCNVTDYGGMPADANAAALAAMPDLLEVCKAWLAYFDRLDRDAEPGDRLAIERRKYHGARVDATRAAVAKAEGREP